MRVQGVRLKRDEGLGLRVLCWVIWLASGLGVYSELAFGGTQGVGLWIRGSVQGMGRAVQEGCGLLRAVFGVGSTEGPSHFLLCARQRV